ncbi:MAG: hypothetical protein Q8O89_04490, partial [Nanoarchaeota archaeon]|nr:hypothetical protein [Nanoarchaeota archaeon]
SFLNEYKNSIDNIIDFRKTVGEDFKKKENSDLVSIMQNTGYEEARKEETKIIKGLENNFQKAAAELLTGCAKHNLDQEYTLWHP